jgi:hypothetical protein
MLRSGAVAGATFEGMPVEPGISENDGLHSPSIFYSDTSSNSWQVTVTGALSLLRLPMVSDDGLSLLLLDASPPHPTQPVLALYRKQTHLATLVRSYTLADLWSEDELYPQGRNQTSFGGSGSTLEWFADAAFEFSPDSRPLL